MGRLVFALTAALVMLTPQAAAGITVYAVAVKVRVDVPIEPIPDLPARPYQLSYLATAATGGAFSFTIFLDAASGSTIDTRWAYAGAPYIEPAVFDAASRALLGTSAYSPFWVNNAALSGGSVILGNDPAIYLGLTPLGHLFDSALASYYFDPLSGILLLAQTKDLQKAITLAGEGYVAAMPSANPRATHSQEYSWDPVDIHPTLDDPTGIPAEIIRQVRIRITSGLEPGPDAPNANPQNPTCGGSFNQIFGGSAPCDAPFSVTGDFTILRDEISFPAYAMGNVSGEFQNPAGKTYHAFSCEAHYPKTDQLDATEPECKNQSDWTTPRSNGQHRLHGIGTIQFCLYPVRGFTCPWQVAGQLE